jgi:predicted DNA-binding protein (UPF0251 family)
MPRRKQCRKVFNEPTISVFKPAGIPARELEEVRIAVDEFEAVRLADYAGLNQRDACVLMEISQPTFNRVLSSARRKIAQGLVKGMVLRIEGGRYSLPNDSAELRCIDCGESAIVSNITTHECEKCGSTQLRWVT